ncbi:MAG: hypothetical protein ACQETL_16780 [Bacteroidota bacterium]
MVRGDANAVRYLDEDKIRLDLTSSINDPELYKGLSVPFIILRPNERFLFKKKKKSSIDKLCNAVITIEILDFNNIEDVNVKRKVKKTLKKKEFCLSYDIYSKIEVNNLLIKFKKNESNNWIYSNGNY